MKFNYLKTSMMSIMAVGALAFSTSVSAASWQSIITGGSAADGQTSSIQAGWNGNATIVANPAGEGVVFEYPVSENTPNDNGNYDDWKSQMFICFDEPLIEGDVVKVSFDHYCTDTRNVGMQAQGNKGTYQGNFQGFETKSEWQEYSQEFEVTAQYAGAEGFKTIAICLSSAPEAATFYINNVVVVKEVPDSSDAPVPASVLPAAGEVESLESVSLVFNDSDVVSWNVTDRDLAPAVYTENGETYTSCGSMAELTAEGNVLTYNISREVKAGSYIVKFPAGSYTVNGVPGAACEYAYTVTGVETDPFEMVVTPSTDIVEEINAIAITFPNATTVTSLSEAELDSETAPRLYLIDEDGNEQPRDMMYPHAEANRLILTVYDQAFPVTAPGTYVIKIPAGCYSVDGVEGQAIELTYTIPEPSTPTYTVTPEEGMVEVLETIEIAFDGVDQVVWSQLDTETAPYIEDMTGARKATFYNVSAEGNKLFLTHDGFSLPGVYNVVIPAGSYGFVTGQYTEEETEEVKNTVLAGQEIVLEYDVIGLAKYTVEPAVNVVSEISEFFITFNEGPVTLPEELNSETAPYIEYVKADGEHQNRGVLVPEVVSDKVLRIHTWSEPLTDEGEYIIVIPGTSYFINGLEGFDIELNYTVVPDMSAKYSVDPAEGDVAELHTVAINFEETETAFWNVKAIAADPDLAPVLTCEDAVFEVPSLSNLYSEAGTLFAAIGQPDPIKENGHYVITIPAGSYTVAGKTSVDIIIAYNLDSSSTAVKSLFGENVNVNVYDINGRLVLRNADAAAIKALRGIYVIDGKKYILN